MLHWLFLPGTACDGLPTRLQLRAMVWAGVQTGAIPRLGWPPRSLGVPRLGRDSEARPRQAVPLGMPSIPWRWELITRADEEIAFVGLPLEMPPAL